MKRIAKIITLIPILSLYSSSTMQGNSCYPRSIFVPRQLSYNPILENALVIDAQHTEMWDYVFSVKPIYTQSVGSKFQEYFTIGHKCSLDVQEDGSGDISSLWFNVVSSDDTFYSSQLSFRPKRQTYGGLFYFAAQLPYNFQLTINTALVTARNNMNICEKSIQNLGTCDGYDTVTQSFANCERFFGRICGAQTKTGLDDIQVKLLYNFYKTNSWYGDVYGLLGIPTGNGSKAKYLFEPLVGSKHVQLGLGTNAQWNIMVNDYGTFSLLGEAKYRYGFRAKECRSFDLKNNGQWSRYMLFVDESDKYSFFPAINDLTFKAEVTPQSSFDLYLAAHFNRKAWNVELGYDLWYRSAEKISLCCNQLPTVGIADLRGIAAQDPQSASTAHISQGIEPDINQMISDASFVPVTLADINLCSGAQASSLSNAVYGSVGYTFDAQYHTIQVGFNAAYEHGSSVNTPDNVFVWLSFDLQFSRIGKKDRHHSKNRKNSGTNMIIEDKVTEEKVTDTVEDRGDDSHVSHTDSIEQPDLDVDSL